jgi:CxxC motif-containing protein (DUF1111 family)
MSSVFVPDYAWGVGDPKKGFVFQRRDPLEIVQENPASGDSFKKEVYAYKIRSRWEADWVEPRFFYLGNDGTVTKFGWKAQNKSLVIFSGEAYNVEMGISNELFSQERDETGNCQIAKAPNDVTPSTGELGAVDNFANFQRFLAPPRPSSISPGGINSINRGRSQFVSMGCALCHTPTLKTNPNATVASLANQNANLYSDLALHAMGPGLADNILQGNANGDEFRTAPLWGLGQRLFFLHDGRTDDLVQAIQAHSSGGNRSFGPSEANAVIDRYNRARSEDQQDLLNFLRSL